MKTLIAISALAVGATLGQQDPSAPPRGLIKIAPQAPTQQAQTPQPRSTRTLDDWRVQLTDKNLAAREKAFDRLVAAARTDAPLRQTLDDWSRDASVGELAWTARLALRELERERSGVFGFPGLDIQGLTLSPFDPAAPFNPDDFFAQFDSNWPDVDVFRKAPGANGDAKSSVESFSLSLGPGGVKCTVKRNVDGQEVSEDYQAESLEQLLDAHPELRDKMHAGGPGRSGTMLRVDPFGWFGTPAAPGQTLDQQPGDKLDLTPLPTDMLGVVVRPVTDAESEQLDLDAGVGLRIDEVRTGTIAQRMGLQPGSILIKMNGRTLKSRDDITEELKKRGAEGQIECVVINRWGQHRTYTWKPDPGRQL